MRTTNRSPSRVVRLRPAGGIDPSVYLERRQRQVDRALEQCLSAPRQPNQLIAAMRYALFPGGKRMVGSYTGDVVQKPRLQIAVVENWPAEFKTTQTAKK